MGCTRVNRYCIFSVRVRRFSEVTNAAQVVAWIRGLCHVARASWSTLSRSAFTRVVGPSSVDIVRIAAVERLFEMFRLVEVELLVVLVGMTCLRHGMGKERKGLLTGAILFHSLLRILLISPVRIDWFSAETWGRRLRAKIMNAFIGRFGVPSAFNVCEVKDEPDSSVGRRVNRQICGERVATDAPSGSVSTLAASP